MAYFDSLAGNGQETATVSSGLNGLSTGSSIPLQSGSISEAPQNSVISTSLTGSEASAASASLSSASRQQQGSKGGYQSTTGSLIEGVSNSLGSGYTAPTSVASENGNTQSSAAPDSGDGSIRLRAPFSSENLFSVLIAGSAAVAGAIFVL